MRRTPLLFTSRSLRPAQTNPRVLLTSSWRDVGTNAGPSKTTDEGANEPSPGLTAAKSTNEHESPKSGKNKRPASVPWYVSNAQVLLDRKALIKLPELPEDAPPALKDIVEYMAYDLGLQDLQIVDTRESETALGPAIMILSDGKNPKHIGRAASLLSKWLKYDHGVVAAREGLLTANYLRVARRRARRKAQRQRYADAAGGRLVDEQDGKTGSWVAIDTKLDGIFIHLLTKDRREALDLDSLLQQNVDGSKLGTTKVYEEYVEPAESETTTGATEKPFSSSGRRHYSTAAAGPTRPSEYGKGDPLLLVANAVSELESLPENERLTETSPFFVSFLKTLPAVLDRSSWRARLKVVAACCIVSSAFSPRNILESVSLQCASGYLVDDVDVEIALQGIAYHRQHEFVIEPADKSTVKKWAAVCDSKCDYVLELHRLVFRSTGDSLFKNQKALALIFRMLMAPSAETVTAVGALKEPFPPAEKMAIFSDHRLSRVWPLLESSYLFVNSETLLFVLTVFVNRESWTSFWRVLDTLSNVTALDPLLVDTAIAMVIKCGNEKQITFALNRFIPSLLKQRLVTLTPELKNICAAGLSVIDPHGKGHASLRQALETDQH